ncbi:MAG: AAA family ATPase, partial [Sedimentisphaerales bacterium]
GFVATTCPMGAGKWREEYNQYFRGRLVVVIPDNDTAGRNHAEHVANSLYGIAGEVRIVELPGLPEKGDVSDWLDAGHQVPELLALIDESKTYKPSKTAQKTVRSDRDRDYTPKPIIVRLEDVEPQEVEWLWDNRIPLGKLSMLVGDPGLGKSFLTLYIAAQVTTGRPWADDPLKQPILEGSVIILSAEDDVSDTIVPRLKDHEADLTKIRAIQGVTYDDPEHEGPCHFNVTAHLPALEQAIAETPGTRLVVIDPLTAYLGKTDSHKNAEVRGALAPLAALAATHRLAVLGVSHLTKNQGTKAIYRTLGSLAFTAAARAVWVVSKDRDNSNRRLLTPAKANLSIDPGGLAFSIIDGVVAFEPDRIDITTDEALCSETDEGAGALDAAKDLLRECLKDGPVSSAEVFKQAKQNSVSERTLNRAKKMLDVKSFKEKDAWFWKMETVPL